MAQLAVQDRIEKRTYEIYEQRARRSGSDMDDWLQAEGEIKKTLSGAYCGEKNPARKRSRKAK
jgi:hypothetical protein